MYHSVSGLVSSETEAMGLTRRLKSDGFSDDDISVIFANREATARYAREEGTKAGEGAAIGAGTGGMVGTALGWLVGLGTLAIPGLGAFIAAGPILAALSGAAAGAAVGGLTGALVGLGIPEEEAKIYEQRVQEGNVLISVRCDTDEEVVRATRAFRDASARDLTYPESASIEA